MPTDREGQERRRRAILEILQGEKPVESQKELVDILRERGIEATQSSVSRDLSDLGIIRVAGRYEVAPWSAKEAREELLRAFTFVRRIAPAGPFQLVIATDPGAGRMVARAIEAEGWTEMLGLVSDDNAVFIATEDAFDQKTIQQRLRVLLKEAPSTPPT
jgi:transcriptional regulator of arginine metabolism